MTRMNTSGTGGTGGGLPGVCESGYSCVGIQPQPAEPSTCAEIVTRFAHRFQTMQCRPPDPCRMEQPRVRGHFSDPLSQFLPYCAHLLGTVLTAKGSALLATTSRARPYLLRAKPIRPGGKGSVREGASPPAFGFLFAASPQRSSLRSGTRWRRRTRGTWLHLVCPAMRPFAAARLAGIVPRRRRR